MRGPGRGKLAGHAAWPGLDDLDQEIAQMRPEREAATDLAFEQRVYGPGVPGPEEGVARVRALMAHPAVASAAAGSRPR